MPRRRRALLRGRGLLGLAVSTAALVSPLAPFGAPAGAAEPGGWQVDVVRFEPIRPDGTLFVAGKSEYLGAIEVNARRGLAVVSEVGVEDYLRGLSEMPSSWPMEALKAQAIAGRTYLLWEKASGIRSTYKGVGADICATQACQVYTGLAKERGRAGERWAQAVADTAGQVLLHDGRVVLAKYSSSNGGRSVASNRSYLQSVDDPDDAAASPHGKYGHGIGMSQYGAKGKAERGMAAADILASYYGGIRPTQLRPDQLPTTVRVALGWEEEVVRLGGPSPFRVVDGAGTVLAVLTGGQWEVRRGAGGRVHVVPPVGDAQPLAVQVLAVEGSVADPASPAVVRFRLSTAASVTVTAQTAAGAATSPATLVPVGDASQPLPSLPGPGDYDVTLAASSGRDRVASVPFRVRVDPAGTVAPVSPDQPAVVWEPGVEPLAGDRLAGARPSSTADATPPLSPAATAIAGLFVAVVVGCVVVHLVRVANRPF